MGRSDRLQIEVNMDAACKAGNHPLVAIYSTWGEEQDVVRWCPECGAVVIDTDYDGRTMPGSVRKMQLPQLARTAKKG
jgi:hypothetical protein